ncbi:carboxypeptidase S [Mrakia frigida]|uniref:M20 family metallopeptidase n=1 Tax=Mrakia frigida TaxID=29902 RepID=UPI003FCC114A
MSYSDDPKSDQLPLSLSLPPKPKSLGLSARRIAAVAASSLCKQHEALLPSIHDTITKTFRTSKFKEQAIEWLSSAVQFETESYDNNGKVGEDLRWEKFGAFHEHLETAYPLVHKHLKLVKIDTYNLLYEWTGSDSTLLPSLFAAHQDVVPVEPSTYKDWVFPPYSGHYDGTYIWGRGSSDDKSGMIGILAAVETLLALPEPYKPKRTVLLSFGIDEESSGVGAAHLNEYLLETRGENSIAFLIDEGGGYKTEEGAQWATPGVAEKGYLDARVEVRTLGGHSSVPPEHTSIGLLSLLVSEIERNPHVPILTRESPVYELLQCQAAFATLSSRKLDLVLGSAKSDKKLKALEELIVQDKGTRSQLRTTTAVDLISGGVKVNALPETASAVINHRISLDSNLGFVQSNLVSILQPVISSLNLSLSAFPSSNPVWSPSLNATDGIVVITDAWGTGMEAAPRTPTGFEDKAWALLAGTIKGVWATSFREQAEVVGGKKQDIIVSPGFSTGNTDTKSYWNLTRAIFRYNHKTSSDGYTSTGVHSVNEALSADGFVEAARFFAILIANLDEASL